MSVYQGGNIYHKISQREFCKPQCKEIDEFLLKSHVDPDTNLVSLCCISILLKGNIFSGSLRGSLRPP